MAFRVVCSLLLVGGAEGKLDSTCRASVATLFNNDGVAGVPNSDSPLCTLPDPDVVEKVTWSVDAGGSVFTTRADADEVCASMTVAGAKNMCADPCKTRLDTVQNVCAGQTVAQADAALLPKDDDDDAQTLAWWTNWFSVMNQYKTLCTNTCLQYYCANKATVGFEALTPACSTTTTTATATTTSTITVTSTSTQTLTVTTELATTTEVSTMAPVPVATEAPVVVAPVAPEAAPQAPVVVAPVVPQGSMPANLAAAQAVGAAAATANAVLTTGLLDNYSQAVSVHPGWVVGAAVGSVSIAAAAFVAAGRRRSLPASPADEFESLATAE